MTVNYALVRDGIFGRITTRQIASADSLSVPILADIRIAPVKPSGYVVFDGRSGSLYISNGTEWISSNNSCSSIGDGIELLCGNSPNFDIRTIKSLSETIDITVTPSGSISIDVTGHVPTGDPGSMIYISPDTFRSTSLPIGEHGMVLTSDGTRPVWSQQLTNVPIFTNIGTIGEEIYQRDETHNFRKIGSLDNTIDVVVSDGSISVSTHISKLLPLTSPGDILYMSETNSVKGLRTPQEPLYLSSNGLIPEWKDISLGNSGEGTSLVAGGMRVKSITSDGGIVISSSSTEITLSLSPNDIFGERSMGSLIYIDNSGNVNQLPIGEEGRILTSDGIIPIWQSPPNQLFVNTGTGVGLYGSSSSSTHFFRRLRGGQGITLSSTSEDITITASLAGLVNTSVGGLMYVSSAGVEQYPMGMSDQYLSSDGSKPVWVNMPELTSSSGGISIVAGAHHLKSIETDNTIDVESTESAVRFSTSLSKILGSEDGIVYLSAGSSQTIPFNDGKVLHSTEDGVEWKDIPRISSEGSGVAIVDSIAGDIKIRSITSTDNTISIEPTLSGEINLSSTISNTINALPSNSILMKSTSGSLSSIPIGDGYLRVREGEIGWDVNIPLSNVGNGTILTTEDALALKSMSSVNGSINISSSPTMVDFSVNINAVLPSNNGDIVTSVDGELALLPPGTNAQLLTIVDNKPSWQNPTKDTIVNDGSGESIYIETSSNSHHFKTLTTDGTITFAATETEIELSTKLSDIVSIRQGDLLIGSETNTLSIGPPNTVLTSDGVNPIWKIPPNLNSSNTVVVTTTPSDTEFDSLYDALNAIPLEGENAPSIHNPWVVYVYAGRYQERQTVIFREFVYVVGADIGGVLFEPLHDGYDLFHIGKATSLSFCSISNIASPNYACVFDNTGSEGIEYALLHKVNFFNGCVSIRSTQETSYVYFEYVSYSGNIEIDNWITIHSTDHESYFSTENHFVEGNITHNAILVDGSNSYLYAQLCNFAGNEEGSCVHIENGGHVEMRTSYIESYRNALHVGNTGESPSIMISGVTFGINTINLNIEHPNTSGYLDGFSEYNKTIINPSTGDSFFIANTNRQIITVAPKGGNFTTVRQAVASINPTLRCSLTNGSNILTSEGLFNASLHDIAISGEGILPGTTVSYVNGNTMTMTNTASVTAVIDVLFVRATSSTAFTILIQPGVYMELGTIRIDSFISIVGINRDTCIILPISPGVPLFLLKSYASISDLNITGGDPMQYVISVSDGLFSFVRNVVFFEVNRAIILENTSISYIVELQGCIFAGGSGDVAIKTNNVNSDVMVTVSISDMKSAKSYNKFFDLGGINTTVAIRSCALQGTGTGTVCSIRDSCSVNIQGVYISGWADGFQSGDNLPLYPHLAIAGLTQTYITGKILDVTNPTTTGYFNGYIPHHQINIHTSASFFVTGKDETILTVAKKGGDYSSICAAIESINDASPMKLYTISVGPGIFIENPIVMKTFTSIRGAGYQATIIACNDSDKAVVTGADSSLIYGCTFTGCTSPGGRAVQFEGTGTAPGSPFIVDNCILGSNHTLINVCSTSHPAVIILTQCLYGATFDADEGVKVKGVDGQLATLLVYNCVFQDIVTPVPQTLFDVDGDNALLVASNTMVQLNGTNTSVAIRMRNGAGGRIYGCSFVGLKTGVIAENTGDGPGLVMAASSFERCDTMLLIENPNTKGSFIGSVDISKVFIHPLSSFYVRDRITNNLVVSKTGSDYNTIADAIEAINPTITASIVVNSQEITSSEGLFDPSLDGCIIFGSGIPHGTIFTYISVHSGMISLPVEAQLLSTSQLTHDIVDLTFERATELTPYTITVHPGTYSEKTLVVPNYVTISGESKSTCVVVPLDESDLIVNLNGKNTTLKQVTLRGGSVGIRIEGKIGCERCETEVSNVVIDSCGQGIFISAPHAPVNFVGNDIHISGETLHGVLIDGSVLASSYEMVCRFNNLSIELSSQNHTSFVCEGPFAVANINTSIISCRSLQNTTAISLSDGASIMLSGSQLLNSTLDALIIQSDGQPPRVQCTSTIFYNNSGYDIDIQHPSAQGCLTMVTAQKSKVYISDTSSITVSYIDPVVNGTTILGDVVIGTQTHTCNIYPMLSEQTSVGILSGGEIIEATNLTIRISEGKGYIYTASLKYVQWNTESVSVPASSTVYIYFDGISISASEQYPSRDQILFGRVITSESAIDIVEQSNIISTRLPNQLEMYHRNVFGAMIATGLKVSVNTQRQISVTGGSYYYGSRRISPNEIPYGGQFYEYFHSSGSYENLAATTIDNGSYDDGSILVSLPNGCYTKHTLYISGEGIFQRLMMVYGRAVYTALDECVIGELPEPPNYFNESIVKIASVIVKSGDDTFSHVIDERYVGRGISNSTNNNFHGNLQGLLEDDHPQYILANGTRAFSGNVDLGGHNLTGVLSVNGLNFTSHASRHLPNGEDPLSTAEPQTPLSASTPNYIGVGNSFARSDHVHSVETDNVVTQKPGRPNIKGTSSALARADHEHNFPTDVALSVSTSNGEGSSLSFSRADHTHQGVHSLSSLYGDIDVVAGGGIISTVIENTITISTEIGGNEFKVTNINGLNVEICGGRRFYNGEVSIIPPRALSLPPHASGVIYSDHNINYALGAIFGDNVTPIATFITDGMSVLSITDVRVALSTGTKGMTNTSYVDGGKGSDIFGKREGSPFKTIGSALSNSMSGDVVIVYPGNYEQIEPITIPSGVTLKSIGAKIYFSNVLSSIDCVILRDNASIEGGEIIISSSISGNLITGILAESDVRIKGVVVRMSHESHDIANLYGIRILGNTSVCNCRIDISSLGMIGAVRGVIVERASTNTIENIVITTTSASPFYDIEVNHPLSRTDVSGGKIMSYVETSGVIMFDGVLIGTEISFTRNIKLRNEILGTDMGGVLSINGDRILTCNSSSALQNKILTDASNIVTATHLRTGESEISIVSAPPMPGQVLMALSSTNAEWNDVPTYTAGNGITISEEGVVSNIGVIDIVSPDGAVHVSSVSGMFVLSGGYISGNGIEIIGNVIHATAIQTITPGIGINIAGTSANLTISGNYISGNGITITDNVISSTGLISVGDGITLTKGDHMIKTIAHGAGISITDDIDSIIISAEPLVSSGGTSLVGNGNGLVNGLVVKGITAGNGISILARDDDLLVSNNGILNISSGNATINITGTLSEPVITGGYVSGTGILISNNTISNSGVISLAGSPTITISGSPTNPIISANYIAGNGINISGNIITNTSPYILSSSGSIGSVHINASSTSLKGIRSGSGIRIVSSATDIIISSNIASITPLNSTISISGTSPDILISGNYTAGEGIEIVGNIISSTVSSLSLASLGGTYSLLNPSLGALSLKGLTPGAGITIGSNTTSITISNSSPASSVTLSSTGSGSSLVNRGSGPLIAVKSLIGGSGVNITSSTTDVTISSSGVASISASDNTIVVSGAATSPVIRGGYVAGSGILISGNIVSCTDGGSGVRLTSAGGLESLVGNGSGPNLSVKGLVASSGIGMSSNSSAITLSNTGVNSLTASNTTVSITGTSTNPLISANYVAGAGINITGNVISSTGGGSSGGGGIIAYNNSNTFSASSVSFVPIINFPWSNKLYSSYRSGILIYYVSVTDTIFDLRIVEMKSRDILGSDLGVGESGIRSISFDNPIEDGIIQILIRKRSEGTNPIVYGLNWQWNN